MRFLAISVVLVATALGQTPIHVAPGDIVCAGAIQIRVMDGNGSSSTGYTTPVSPTSIVWDPAHPDEFIAGGGSSSSVGGYLVRSVFTAPGQLTTTQLSPVGSFATPAQLCWDQSGQHVIVVTTWGQVHRVNAVTGVVTDITNGTQAWGSSATCGAMDPLTGDIYVGTSSGAIWRIASGASGGTLFRSGYASVAKIFFDTMTAPHRMYFSTSNSFWRIDLGNPSGDEQFFGGFGQPTLTSITTSEFDQNGAIVLATSSSRVYRMPNPGTVPTAGIAPTLVGQYAFPSSSGWVRDITIVGASSEPFRITMASVPILGATLSLENVPAPLGQGWIFLSATAFLPVDTGPFFGIVPDGLTLVSFTTPPAPGGLFSFINTPPAPLTIPQFGMAPFFGQTWDAVAVAFGTDGRFLGRTNVSRATWQ
jgi:hypothetical protein